jgi:hypothetical protein
MIITKLSGGMGNQMFQYAVGRALATGNNDELKLDISIYESQKGRLPHREYDLSIFALDTPIASAREIAYFDKKRPRKGKLAFLYNLLFADRTVYRQEKFFHYDPEVLTLKGPLCLDGYWQSERYFESIGEVIRKDFTLKEQPMSEATKALLEKIQRSHSVCVNVRRADFVSKKGTAEYHGSLGTDYFERAVALLAKITGEPLEFFVFSDDIEWCKGNIKTGFPTTFVEHSHAGERFGLYLYLMRSCKHFIIPNSSFAWWAAWLSESRDKVVIAPRKWFNNAPENNTNDLLPVDWITI